MKKKKKWKKKTQSSIWLSGVALHCDPSVIFRIYYQPYLESLQRFGINHLRHSRSLSPSLLGSRFPFRVPFANLKKHVSPSSLLSAETAVCFGASRRHGEGLRRWKWVVVSGGNDGFGPESSTNTKRAECGGWNAEQRT